MKTLPKKPNSCTPSAGVFKPDISPQRGPSRARRRGTPFFAGLLNVLECIVCFSSYLKYSYIFRYELPIISTRYVKLILFLPLLVFGTPLYAKSVPTTGTASWYSSECCRFNKSPECPTASGKSLYKLEAQNEQFAAMYGVPFGTRVKVINLQSSKSVIVRIWDRGPNKRLNRAIDLGKASFAKIADPAKGLIKVRVEVLK